MAKAATIAILLNLLEDELGHVARAESTGAVVFDPSPRLVASYHPEIRRRRAEKMLLVEPHKGEYIALDAAEITRLHAFLEQIMATRD